MSDWLSEIEEEIEDYPEDWHGEVGVSGRRMARVIREHSKYILYLEGLLNWDEANYTDVIRGNYMSPDAKGLLTEPDGGK